MLLLMLQIYKNATSVFVIFEEKILVLPYFHGNSTCFKNRLIQKVQEWLTE